MVNYEVLVIGNGVGGYTATKAAKEGYRTALIDEPPVGGTCQNYGCKPSKTLIHIADRLRSSYTLRGDGIDLRVKDIDFSRIMKDLRATRNKWQESQREKTLSMDNLDYYETRGKFTDEYTIETDVGVFKGDKVFIAAGARPFIPPIDGIEDIDYLTNESILELKELPEKIVIIGGGYIGVEYAHFMSSMGSDVTIIQRGDKLVKNQDGEISKYLEEKLSERVDIALNTEGSRVEKDGTGYRVIGETSEGEVKGFPCDEIMVAVGRRPNSDRLSLEKTGVRTDRHGYIEVNDHLETSKESIWALGDITGRSMFKHTANIESDIAWHNSKSGEKRSLDYDSVPNAVFTEPKIASVGLSENEAKKERYEIMVGKAEYKDTVKGRITESEGFAKAVVEKDSKRLLGFHIIGPEAHLLLQETVNVAALGGSIDDITTGVHTFPTLTRLIPTVLDRLENVD